MDFRLPWSVLDPSRRATPDFEEARKPAMDGLRRKKSRTDVGKKMAQREMEFHIWCTLGAWARGWSDGSKLGGPGRVWQGPESVGEDDSDTANRVVAALEDWQAWLVTLGETFDPIAAATKDLDDVDVVSRGAAELLPLALARTEAESEWPRTFAKSLSWCIQACGRADEDLSEVIEAAIGDRFESGKAPSDALASEVCDDLALEVAMRDKPPFVDDALEAWWVVRDKAPWVPPSTLDQRGAEGDGHRRYIQEADQRLSKERASAMIRAMQRERWYATQDTPLDTSVLMEWQEIAMVNKEIFIRRGDAFAKNKGERYGRPKDLEARLEKALHDAEDPALSPITRAARVYLDICFLHPFTDGNTRAARLALDYVLSRDHLALHDATPIFELPRWAHDKREPWRFSQTLNACVGPA